MPTLLHPWLTTGDHQAPLVDQDQQDKKVTKELLDQKDLRDTQDTREPLVIKELLEPQAHKV